MYVHRAHKAVSIIILGVRQTTTFVLVPASVNNKAHCTPQIIVIINIVFWWNPDTEVLTRTSRFHDMYNDGSEVYEYDINDLENANA